MFPWKIIEMYRKITWKEFEAECVFKGSANRLRKLLQNYDELRRSQIFQPVLDKYWGHCTSEKCVYYSDEHEYDLAEYMFQVKDSNLYLNLETLTISKIVKSKKQTRYYIAGYKAIPSSLEELMGLKLSGKAKTWIVYHLVDCLSS